MMWGQKVWSRRPKHRFSFLYAIGRTEHARNYRSGSPATVSGGTDSSPVSDNDMASFVQLATGYKRLIVLTLDLGITNKDIRSTYSPRSIWPYCERRFPFPP
jgi:hypothetical protein